MQHTTGHYTMQNTTGHNTMQHTTMHIIQHTTEQNQYSTQQNIIPDSIQQSITQQSISPRVIFGLHQDTLKDFPLQLKGIFKHSDPIYFNT